MAGSTAEARKSAVKRIPLAAWAVDDLSTTLAKVLAQMQQLTKRCDRTDLAREELQEQMALLQQQMDRSQTRLDYCAPFSSVKSRVNPRPSADNETDSNQSPLSLDGLSERTSAMAKDQQCWSDTASVSSDGSEDGETSEVQYCRLKRRIRRARDRFRRWRLASEVRLQLVEARAGFADSQQFHQDYADHLDGHGEYMPDTFARLQRKHLSAPVVRATARAQEEGDNWNDNSRGRLQSLEGPAQSINARPLAMPGLESCSEPKWDRSRFQWLTPLNDNSEFSGELTRISLDVSGLKPKALYGMFVKLRKVANIQEVMPTARQGLPIVEALPENTMQLASDNCVLLLEYQTNRARKVNGVHCLKFESIPVIFEGDSSLANFSLANEAADQSPPCIWIEEREPARVTQDQHPVRLMQYETTFGPTKRKLLKVPHVVLDNRRKYHVVVPACYWPIYEIWEMKGPRAVEDRDVLMHRSAESPVLTTPANGCNMGAVCVRNDRVEFDGELSNEQAARDVPHSQHKAHPKSNLSASAPEFTMASNRSPVPAGSEMELAGDGLQCVEFPPTNQIPSDSGAAVSEFARHWKGTVEVCAAVKQMFHFVVTLTMTLFLPSLVERQAGEPIEKLTISMSCRDKDQQRALLGVHHATLQRIQNDLHAHWMCFALRITPFSESFVQFLQQFHLSTNPTPERIREWLCAKRTSNGDFESQVPWGSNMELVERFQHADPALARENACLLAMERFQTLYPLSFVVCRPRGAQSEMIEAIESFIRIHSCFSEEYLQERKVGDTHQYIFRSLVLAESNTASEAADRVLSSLETILRSNIQLRAPFSDRFLASLREDGVPSPDTACSIIDAGHAPTKANMARINSEHGSRINGSTNRQTDAMSRLHVAPSSFRETATHAATQHSTVSNSNVVWAKQGIGNSDEQTRSMAFPHSTGSSRQFVSDAGADKSSSMILSLPAVMDSAASLSTSGTGMVLSLPSVMDSAASLSRMGTNRTGGDSSLTSGTSANPTSRTMTEAEAIRLVELLGVAPSLDCSVVSGFAAVISGDAQQISKRNELTGHVPSIDHIFEWTEEKGGMWRCDIRLFGDVWGTGRHTKREDAKEAAAKNAWMRLRKSPDHYRMFLVKVPAENDTAPTASLLQFIQLHSVFKNGDDLQGIYKAYMQQCPTMGGSSSVHQPAFECRLMFRQAELEMGKGDTKRRAREEASRSVLRKLREAIQVLGVDAVASLSARFSR